jgi:sulfur relay (sulfurtransferase) DsrC/TusE family protein
MRKNKQLAMGKKVEREHKGTVRYIKSYLKRYNRLPPQKRIYKHIAQDHIKEVRTYYTKLKKARL